MKMVKKIVLTLCGLCLLSLPLLAAGCNSDFAVTAEIEDVDRQLTMQGKEVNIPDTGLGIIPAIYTIDNFVNDYTVDLEYRIYNELDYASVANIEVWLPNSTQLRKNPEYELWAPATVYCKVVEPDLMVSGDGNKDITIRVYVPPDVEMPDKWLFWVGYSLEGHKWGDYVTTLNNNFVFVPSNFEVDITDTSQKMTWLTWGNSPEIIVRATYGEPAQTIDDGILVYQGVGEQIIQDWWYAKENKYINRQYTKFDIEDTSLLPFSGGEKLFYKVWIQYLEGGVWRGKWNPVGQSLYLPVLSAKVVVNK